MRIGFSSTAPTFVLRLWSRTRERPDAASIRQHMTIIHRAPSHQVFGELTAQAVLLLPAKNSLNDSATKTWTQLLVPCIIEPLLPDAIEPAIFYGPCGHEMSLRDGSHPEA
jgi:hypothetical protein